MTEAQLDSIEESVGFPLPDAYRHVPRISKPFAVPTVLAALDQLLASEDVP